MKKIFNFFFRKREDILLGIGFLAAIIIFFHFALFRYKLYTEDSYYDFYRYSVKVSLLNQGPDQGEESDKAFEELIDYLQKMEGANVSGEVSVHRRDVIEYQMITVVMVQNEPLAFLQGMDVQSETGTDGAYIGESILERGLMAENGDLVFADGLTLAVKGVVKNYMSGGYDDAVYVLWEQCSPGMRETLTRLMIEQGFLDVSIESQEDISRIYQDLAHKAESLGFSMSQMVTKRNLDFENVWYRMYNTVFQGVAVFFGMACCVSVSLYWIQSMKKEAAIRRAYGYSVFQLILYILGRAARIMLLSFVCFVLFESLAGVKWNEQDVSLWEGLGEITVYMSELILSLILVLSYVFWKQINKMSLNGMLRDE